MPCNRNLLSPSDPIEQIRQVRLGLKSPYQCHLYAPFKLVPTSLIVTQKKSLPVKNDKQRGRPPRGHWRIG